MIECGWLAVLHWTDDMLSITNFLVFFFFPLLQARGAFFWALVLPETDCEKHILSVVYMGEITGPGPLRTRLGTPGFCPNHNSMLRCGRFWSKNWTTVRSGE